MFEDWTNCQVCEYNPTGDKCELFGLVIRSICWLSVAVWHLLDDKIRGN